MELYIIRHGETDRNKAKVVQGRSDIPLNEDGRRGAFETGEALKGVIFDYAFSSPLCRAVDTARLLLEGAGQCIGEISEEDAVKNGPDGAETRIPIVTDDRLYEMDLGTCDGKPYAVEHPDPDIVSLFASFYDGFRNYDPPEGGETVEEVCERSADFIQTLIKDPVYENARILISSHCISGRALMKALWGGEDFWHGAIPPNSSVCIVTLRHGEVTEIRQDAVLHHMEVPKLFKEVK